MKDADKTKEQLIDELVKLRQRIVEFQDVEEEFHRLILNVPGVVYRCDRDPEWTIEFISEAIQTISGYPVSDFIQNKVRSFKSIIYPEDRAGVYAFRLNKIDQKKPYVLEYRIVDAVDNIHWVYEKGQGVFDKSGNFLWLNGVIVDITERKELEERVKKEEHSFKVLFENMKSGVAIYEAAGNGSNFIFKDINKAGERLSRAKREDVIGKKVTEAFSGIKEFGLFEVFQKVWKTGEAQYHPVSLYKDGRLSSWYENFVFKLPTGEIVAIYEDVTERRRMADESGKRIHELEVFYKASMGREERVLELKKKIEELEEELKAQE